MAKKTVRAVVLYKSKYGSAKRYADWIAKGAGADLFDISVFHKSFFEQYDTIVFGTSVRMGRISNIGFIKKNWKYIAGRRLAVFTASGAPSDDPVQQKVFEASLPADMQKNMAYFPMQGAFDYKTLDTLDKFIMQFPRFISLLRWWFTRDKEVKEFLDGFYSPQDWTKKEAVSSIITFIKKS